MKATKTTLTIRIEVLSTDSIPGMIQDIVSQVLDEKGSGMFRYRDGDEISWDAVSENVEF